MLWRSGPVALLIGMVATLAAAQQLPPGVDPETGARPGNEIGTGSSLPLSDKASNITPQDTTSTIAPNLPSPAVGPDASVRTIRLRHGARCLLVAPARPSRWSMRSGRRCTRWLPAIAATPCRPSRRHFRAQYGRCCQDLEITRKPRLRARGDSAGRSSGSNGA